MLRKVILWVAVCGGVNWNLRAHTLFFIVIADSYQLRIKAEGVYATLSRGDVQYGARI
jgi:hypothetical protein